jgi:hypothetical protein
VRWPARLIFEHAEDDRSLPADPPGAAHLLVEPVVGQPEAPGGLDIGQPEAIDALPQFFAYRPLSCSLCHTAYGMVETDASGVRSGIEAVLATLPRPLTTNLRKGPGQWLRAR